MNKISKSIAEFSNISNFDTRELEVTIFKKRKDFSKMIFLKTKSLGN